MSKFNFEKFVEYLKSRGYQIAKLKEMTPGTTVYEASLNCDENTNFHPSKRANWFRPLTVVELIDNNGTLYWRYRTESGNEYTELIPMEFGNIRKVHGKYHESDMYGYRHISCLCVKI